MSATINLGRVVGYSAYEVAVQNGFVGTEEEWIESLKGEQGVSPFKGWFGSLSELQTTYPDPNDNDFAYVQAESVADPIAIYEGHNGSWVGTGRFFNPSNNQEFASGEFLNEVHLINDCTTGGVNDVLTAEQGVVLAGQVSQLEHKVDRVKAVFNAAYNLFMSATYKEDVTYKMYVLRTAIDQLDDIPLTGLSISGVNEISGAAGITSQYIVNYTPDNTTQTEVIWSIISGGNYATIDATTGLLTVLAGASSNNVTIRATSAQNNSIYAEKTVTVTGIAYTQLSYIKTGPNTYVDTGITPTSDMTIYTRAQRVSNGIELIMGCDGGNNLRIKTMFLTLQGTTYCQAAYIGSGSAKSNSVTIGPIVTMETIVNSPFIAFTTGIATSWPNTLPFCSPASGPSIYLYATNGGDEDKSSARVYNVKFYKSGDLIADFVPVLVNNSTPMVLNLVNMQLYQFTGTGTINYE